MTTSAIELRDVWKRFGKTEIVRGASLAVAPGERMAVIGPNGAGKTTLFNLMSGRQPFTSGDILLHGRSIRGLRAFEVSRRGLSRSFQISNLFHRLSVFENLRCAALWALGYRYSFWRQVRGMSDANERAERLMEMTGLTARRDTPAGLLPYAEQRALEIGIAVSGDADVILLDEPTAGMSRSESDAAVSLIRRLTAGKTLLMVEHDMGVVFGLADHVAVVVHGQVIACDAPDRVRANPLVQEAYLGAAAEEVAS
ncbi:ABC transporter ATP-binding protein [Variovorax sp. WS11]|uniref:ABC transporter ATP-binding protein n=1 Tax=Variovorax sp. WS11 TaxID=1105204 RepID=UPI000D0DA6B2|nr:ABC transporter ATP-binding protein [Variovorax sp. WS11]NDZ18925.1 ABC transporter ATP-binding protein [Variovorax sp. WS11]PSL82436.1 ABC transporter ATP-binding protein [Variovorax sp. WS11]